MQGRRKQAGLLFGPLYSLIDGWRCCVPNCVYWGEPHHVRFRSRGGLDWLFIRDGDLDILVGNLVPLCPGKCDWPNHHAELHASERDFDERYIMAMPAVARKIGQHFAITCPDVYDRLLLLAQAEPSLRVQWERAA